MLLFQIVLHVWLNVTIKNYNQRIIKSQNQIKQSNLVLNELASYLNTKKKEIILKKQLPFDPIKTPSIARNDKLLNGSPRTSPFTATKKKIDPPLFEVVKVIYSGVLNDEECFSVNHCFKNVALSAEFVKQSIYSGDFSYDYIDKRNKSQKRITFRLQNKSMDKTSIYLEFTQSNKDSDDIDYVGSGSNSQWRRIRFKGSLLGDTILGKLTWCELTEDKTSYINLSYDIVLSKN